MLDKIIIIVNMKNSENWPTYNINDEFLVTLQGNQFYLDKNVLCKNHA